MDNFERTLNFCSKEKKNLYVLRNDGKCTMVFTDTLAKMSQSFFAYSFTFLAFLFWEKSLHFLEDASAKNAIFLRAAFKQPENVGLYLAKYNKNTSITPI